MCRSAREIIVALISAELIARPCAIVCDLSDRRLAVDPREDHLFERGEHVSGCFDDVGDVVILEQLGRLSCRVIEDRSRAPVPDRHHPGGDGGIEPFIVRLGNVADDHGFGCRLAVEAVERVPFQTLGVGASAQGATGRLRVVGPTLLADHRLVRTLPRPGSAVSTRQ
jgi:hypothetical protein